MTAPAGKAELAGAIVHRLDRTATAIVKEHIRAQCEECEQDFHVCFLDGVIDEKERPVWIDVKNQRARLKAIEKTLAAAARAIMQEPQESDWRPNPTALLVRFINRFAEQGGDRATVEKFKAATRWFDLLSISSTELLTLFYAWSRLAGGKAQQLTPDARSIPVQDFFAHWSWQLVHEFAPELAPDVAHDSESEEAGSPPEQRTVADYIATSWSRLSPEFRTVHNRLLQARGLPAIPEPEVDHFVRPTPTQRRRFPWKKYLTVTGLLAEYVRGPNDMKFRDACLRVRRRYQA